MNNWVQFNEFIECPHHWPFLRAQSHTVEQLRTVTAGRLLTSANRNSYSQRKMITSNAKELSKEWHIEELYFTNYIKQPKTIVLKTVRGVEWEIFNLSKDVKERNLGMRPFKKMNGFGMKCKFSSKVLGVGKVIDFSKGDVFVCYNVPSEFDLTIEVVIFPFTEPFRQIPTTSEQINEQKGRSLLIGEVIGGLIGATGGAMIGTAIAGQVGGLIGLAVVAGIGRTIGYELVDRWTSKPKWK